MTTPPEDSRSSDEEGVSLHKPAAEPDFDPYRFGAPEHPVPPEYAPPGYVPPPPTAPPVSPPPGSAPPFGQYPQSGQYPQYPSYGGQYPPPPSYGQYPPPRTGNGKAVASLVLGIASIVLCWLTFLDAIPVILGLIFGFLGVHQAGRLPNAQGRGMAIAGIVCSVIGAIIAIALTVWVLHLANQCGGFGGNSTVLKQCIQNHI